MGGEGLPMLSDPTDVDVHQIAEKVDAGSERKVSEYTVHRSCLFWANTILVR